MCKNITVSSKFGHLYSHVKHMDFWFKEVKQLPSQTSQANIPDKNIH